jgi:GNAT superfamily N-acetyltransferase
MIAYIDALDGVAPEQLQGFFVGWPNPPSPETHLRLLAGSDAFLLAVDDETGRTVGYITALTDGVLSSFIPLLEVLPDYQGRGIGRELMARMLARLAHLPNVDLLCDPDVEPFYERFGMLHAGGMVLRRPMGPSITGRPE